ncbi:hypothetical protein D4R30_00050 [archaeon]|nr:MAG: hypothetical protein D4R30_00050 [archaeon]
MAKVAGSLWVEGATLHYVDANGREWEIVGHFWAVVGGYGALAGSIWIEGDTLHYVDSVGNLEYWCEHIVQVGGPSGGIPGSIWVEGTLLHWLRPGPLEVWFHNDQAHSDTGHSNWTNSWGNHSDVAWVDGTHTDWNDSWYDYQNWDDYYGEWQ